MWSKGLPLNARALSLTTSWVKIPAWACETVVASDLGFLPPVTTGWSRISCNMAEKMTKIEIPNYHMTIQMTSEWYKFTIGLPMWTKIICWYLPKQSMILRVFFMLQIPFLSLSDATAAILIVAHKPMNGRAENKPFCKIKDGYFYFINNTGVWFILNWRMGLISLSWMLWN